jgi:hypothetical protein
MTASVKARGASSISDARHDQIFSPSLRSELILPPHPRHHMAAFRTPARIRPHVITAIRTQPDGNLPLLICERSTYSGQVLRFEFSLPVR